MSAYFYCRWRMNHIAPVVLALAMLAAQAVQVTVADTHRPPLDSLFGALEQASTAAEGREREAAIWEYWFDQSPNESVRASLDAGIERREAYDFEAAEVHFDAVVAAAPNYAEGFNQRAFIRFLRENYVESMQDLDKALALEPRHFGALAGMYQILMRQNRPDAAMTRLREAVRLHPWLRERGALPEAMWPDRYRELRRRADGI